MRATIGILVAMLAASCGPASPTSATRLPVASTLEGTVFDTAFRVVPGARVEVLDGPQAGTSATTDATGKFALTGAFDRGTRFRATKEGHLPSTVASLAVCGLCNFAIYLAVDTSTLNLAGDYAVTLTADSSCTNLPSVVRSRTYLATIAPIAVPELPGNTSFRVNLVGGPFLHQDHYSFTIRSAGDFVRFSFESLVEQLATGTIEFAGTGESAVGSSSVSTFAASFDGQVDYCEPSSGAAVCVHTRCGSANHRLFLERR